MLDREAVITLVVIVLIVAVGQLAAHLGALPTHDGWDRYRQRVRGSLPWVHDHCAICGLRRSEGEPGPTCGEQACVEEYAEVGAR